MFQGLLYLKSFISIFLYSTLGLKWFLHFFELKQQSNSHFLQHYLKPSDLLAKHEISLKRITLNAFYCFRNLKSLVWLITLAEKSQNAMYFIRVFLSKQHIRLKYHSASNKIDQYHSTRCFLFADNITSGTPGFIWVSNLPIYHLIAA